MTYVVPFKSFRPGSRDDGIHFTSVEVMESTTEDGVYELIDAFELDPVDSDPEHPAYRDFTTTLAVHENGWYKIVFVDDDGNRQESDPIHQSNIEGIYYTTFAKVRAWLNVTEDQVSDVVLTRPVKMAQHDIDAACGGWASHLDTGLKFATEIDEYLPVLDPDVEELLSQATCAQVEYRMTMGDDFMVKEQYEAQSGPSYSTTGKLRKVCGTAYTFLNQGGLLRLHGKSSNRYADRYGDLPRIN
jgi:hypothetical protein